MTSLPVVQEDTTDDYHLHSPDSTCYGQEVLQKTLDLCLDQLDKLQLSSTSTLSQLPDGRTPAVDMPSISASNVAGKSDSGFWSQSYDSYRSSMATLEDSADVDLDAILGQLSALGDELESEARSSEHATAFKTCQAGNVKAAAAAPSQPRPPVPHKPNFNMSAAPGITGAGANVKSVSPVAAEFDLVEHYYKQLTSADSPDNDSAFSDNVSCISSESGASRTDASCMSSGSSSKSSSTSLNAPSPTQATNNDATAAAAAASVSMIPKAEKNKITLEKISECDTKKLFITVHFNEDVRKSLLVDEKMDCLDICQSLAEKSDTKLTPDCAIVEYLPELNIERFFEDHENLVENMLMWDRDGNSKNKLLYVERKDKYHFILRPELYLTGFACKDTEYDELTRRQLLKDYFSSHNIPPPELDGNLYLRNDAKKSWKKYWFVLRASGLYYSKLPKGKQTSSADLICLTHFDAVDLYRGINWRKKLKAPTEFGFALKLPQIQSVKAMKNIKFVCLDDQASLDLWMTGIRIAKYGRYLIENFNRALERAAAMEASSENNSDNSAQQTPVISRRASSNDTAFDDDLTTGTIKRKPPHSNPKLPFTSKTSQMLMRNADERRSYAINAEVENLPPPPPELLTNSIPSPLSPNLLRSPPPTAPKPSNLQRKSSLNEGPKKSSENIRHSLIPTVQSSQLPFLHELKNKSPVVTKKVLAPVPEIHDMLSQPSSPVRRPLTNSSPVPHSSPAKTNGYLRTQSMSPTHKPVLPPQPPRRSDGTKLSDAELLIQRKSGAVVLDRSVSVGENPTQRVSTAHPNFMADLTRVLASKKRHSLLLNENMVPAEGTDYLPPPPPELLRPSSPMDEPKKRPPPPPKRSEATYLSKGK